MEDSKICMLGISDAVFMREIIEDDHMVYDKKKVSDFLAGSNNYAFGCVCGKTVIGLAYGYRLDRPDGKSMLYIHSVGVLPQYQNQGIGSKIMQFASDYSRKQSFSEMFVITDKGNPRACRVYEKAGGKTEDDGALVYVVDYQSREK